MADRNDAYILIGTHRMVKDLDRETTRISAAYGLTFPQFMVLEALMQKDGLSVGEIKEAILSSNGTIPVIINNLEKMELVQRVTDPTDHRKSLISLTDKGRELIKQVCPENDKMFKERFGVWTKEEKKVLVRLLSKYHDAQDRRGENHA